MKRIASAFHSACTPRLFVGFALCSVATCLELHAGLGLGAWSVFHQGLTCVLSITFGQASIASSLLVILVSRAFEQRIGWGTVLNMLVIGFLIDLFEALSLVPDAANVAQGIAMMLLSVILTSAGSLLYMSCASGCGPRDGLMCGITARTHAPVGLVRSALEGAVLTTGWAIGGSVGIGTILFAVGIGPVMQLMCRARSFDVASIHHSTLTGAVYAERG